MAQVPECVVCLQPYDDFLHVPRVLACGHSFCELCLMQLQSAWQPSFSSLSHDSNKDSPVAASGAVIRCPECSHRTKLPIGGQQSLPKNVELLRLLPSLIKEADLADSNTGEGGGRDTECNSSAGLKGVPDGNGNKNRAAGRKDAARIRRSGDRRPNVVKGKERGDSNCSLACSNSESWLIPCDLYSPDNSKNWDVRGWIVPEKAIQLRAEEDSSSPRARLVDNNSQNSQQRELFLLGEIMLERDRLSSAVPVSLLQLRDVSCPPPPQQGETKMSYEESVLKAWESCQYEVKNELQILFRISFLSRRVCKILGVWMNRQRNTLFLVSQLPSLETVSAWEMMKKSFQSEELTNSKKSFQMEISKDFNKSFESKTDEGAPGREAISVSGAEVTPPDLCNACQAAHKFSSLVVEQMLSRVGLGLCEILWEVHSQGFVFGALSPNCFILDRFGNLLIDLNAALKERSSLHDATTLVSNSTIKSNTSEGECGSSINAQEEDFDGQNYTNCCWRRMSPEALSLLTNNVACWKDSKRKTDGNAARSSSSNSKVQNRLTCQTDVWSMGCLLLELVSGKAPFDGLTFPEVVQKVLVEKEKPEDFLGLLLDSSPDNGGSTALKRLANVLSKCFEYDPDERPQLDDLCHFLTELGGANSISSSATSLERPLQSEAVRSAEQKCWVLCLPGFVRDGYMDSSNGQEADGQESQRRLELLRLENGALDVGRELQPCGLEQKGTLEGHLDYVTALAVCGDHLLSASFDKTIRVWSLEDHALQQTLKGHSHLVAALAVDQNTSRCFSGDSGGNICAWKIGEAPAEPPLLATWKEHDDWRYTGVTSLAVSADGVLYSGSGDRTVKAWSLQDFNQFGTMEGHKAQVSALLVDGELLYSGSWDGTIHVWWRSDQSLVAVLGGGTTSTPALGGVRTLCMSDSFLFAGRDSGAIQVWRDEECLTTVKAHDSVVSALYVEADFLYTGSWDEQIKAWKVDEFLSNPTPTLVRKCGSALSSMVSDGDRLFTGVADRAIKVYSLLGDTWASLVEML